MNHWFLEAGDPPHEWVGYGLLALVTARVVWGFVGPANARFSHFVAGPRRTLASLSNFSEEHQHHTGHTLPAGWMIVLLLTLVVATGITGWMQELDAFWGIEWVQILHEVLANVLIGAAGVHVCAVLWIQWRYRLPLLQSMTRSSSKAL